MKKDPADECDDLRSVLPADSGPCVWMTAGVVAYKVCDRGYDCGHCPLDAGLCGREIGSAGPAEDRPAAPDGLDFPQDRLYHPSHTWALQLGRSRVRIGVDAFAARLLAGSSSIVLPAEGTVLQQGRVSFWIADEGRLLPLVSAVSGRVLARNQRVQGAPGLVAASPYEEGWLLEVDCPRWAAEYPRLVDAPRQRALSRRQAESFRRRVARFVEQAGHEIGPTLADGGEPLSDARRILGPARYRRLILAFLR